MILHSYGFYRFRRGAMPVVCLALAALAVLLSLPQRTGAQTPGDFRSFIETLWPEARAKGVTRATFDAAFKGVTPDMKAPDLILPGKKDSDAKGQAEFTRTPEQYLNASYLQRLAGQGRELRVKHRRALEKIEREIGVPAPVVLAIWGRESAFSTQHSPPHYTIEALATQAYLGRRKELFRGELIWALKMLQDKVRTRQTMRSSWAGAMGLTQFMPSEYYSLAYDLDGDGRKDIWGSVPDALASAANQLRGRGWIPGLPWGFEVRLPAGASCALEGPPHARTVAEWAKLGVMRVRGQAFPKQALNAQAFILTPGGAYGPAFLALENFMVIKRYNMSDLYALFVGDLSDRIAGAGTFDAPWGKVRQLSARGIEEIQTRLQAKGYDISKIDGKAGMNTRALIGAYQRANRLKVDCWPSEALLGHLRSAEAGRLGAR
ncbi:MAG TPA: lytic murein transglycosylase [Hyphomicrobiaceae bacterium]|nr:lytic murein transglycosylase [Hyphomicrobiaceae bacterium]